MAENKALVTGAWIVIVSTLIALVVGFILVPTIMAGWNGDTGSSSLNWLTGIMGFNSLVGLAGVVGIVFLCLGLYRHYKQ